MSRNAMQFVVKISKFCNLRCDYCYEYNELSNKARMPLDGIKSFFENVADYSRENKIERVSFVWHGGEPMLVPIRFYEEIGALQRATFGDSVIVENTAQTNLTVLNDEWCRFLSEKKFFIGIGVSFDVYGDQRIDINGRLQTKKILKNMQRLIDNGIDFGAICVLARNTLSNIERIYSFYEQLSIECRFLPFYRSISNAQVTKHALSCDEIVTALKIIFDRWLESEHALVVEPLDTYLNFAVAYVKGQHRIYDKFNEETIFIVSPEGDIWDVADTYNPAYNYGNVFSQSFETILTSPKRIQAASHAQKRVEKYCTRCPYLGACPGFFAGDATAEQRSLLEVDRCPVKEVLPHIIEGIDRAGMTGIILSATSTPSPTVYPGGS